jgi:ABC-type antimicrobial peptide transport system permease subunit
MLDNLTAAREQMALSLGFHIVFAVLGVGLPWLLLFAVGAFLGWVLVRAASGQGVSMFVAPSVPLTVVLIGGAVAGLLAGLLPARRAARLHLLQAIATE